MARPCARPDLADAFGRTPLAAAGMSGRTVIAARIAGAMGAPEELGRKVGAKVLARFGRPSP